MVQGFKTGKIPMFVSGPYMATMLQNQAPEISGKWAVAKVPADKTSTSLMAGSNMAVFSESTKVDASLKFMAYLNRSATQQVWFTSTNDLPARQDALEALRPTGGPNLAVYAEQMKSSKIVPPIKQWGAVAPEMVRALQKVCIGGDAVGDSVSTFAATATSLTRQ
jgi:multiple sugar transport system substrate-binding protein